MYVVDVVSLTIPTYNIWLFTRTFFSREFYTGSDRDLTEGEREILEELFSTKLYVQKEIEYSYISTQGSVSQSRYSRRRFYP